jgi:polyhydroxybutyrate depolymerase
LDDDDVRFEGGASLHRGGERRYYSVDRSLGFWVAANRCTGAPAESRTRGGAVHTRTWETCADGAATALTTIAGWGHLWPGPRFTAELPADHPLVGYDAAEVVWDFCKRFP